MVSNYAFCESKADLAKLVVARVKEVFDGKVDDFGTIDFKVEDTPTPLEASKMGEKELERAYDIAAATYGITTVRLFDNDGVQLDRKSVV